MEFNFDDGIEHILKEIERSQKPIVIAIGGGSCSGKSYLTKKLQKYHADQGINISNVPLDNFYKDLLDPELPKHKESGRKLFDVPESYRHELFLRTIQGLLRSYAKYIPDYDYRTNRIICDLGILIEAENIIIAEGLFVINFLAGINNVINIYVDAKNETRLERRVKRDMANFGVTREQVLDFWNNRVLPYHIKYVEPQKKKANIIINT